MTRTGKPIQFYASDETVAQLEAIRAETNQSTSEILRLLIDNAHYEMFEEESQSVPERVVDTEYDQTRRLEPVRRKSQAFRG